MNAPISISLNGTFIQGRIEGLDQLTVTKRRKDSEKGGGVTTTFSSELTFYDDGYDILKTILIDDPDGFGKEVPVKIYDDECNAVIFDGKILGNAIDWCYPECAIKATIVEIDPILSCIQSILIDDNRLGFYNRPGIKIPYCIFLRPEFLFDLLLTVGLVCYVILFFIEYLLVPFIFGIAAIVWLICLGIKILRPRTNCSKVDPIGAVVNWVDEMDKIKRSLVSCGRYHTAAYLRDYIINACTICGVNFKSSILNDNSNPVGAIYTDTVLFSAPAKKGFKKSQGYTNLVRENAPIETLETLFNNYLNPTFNAKWEIIGNDLYFERKDFFNNISQWIDTDNLLNEDRIQDGLICYKWTDKQMPSYGRYEYSADAVEIISNEIKPLWGDIIEWNPNRNPIRKGEHTVTLPFSAAAVAYDDFIAIPSNTTGSVGSSTSDHQVIFDAGAMAMHSDYALNYRLLLVARNGQINTYDDSFTGISTGLKNYNYPFWFKEGIQGVYGYQNNLYSLFHYIDDPRQPNAQKFNFDFTFEYNCAEVAAFSFEKYVRLYVGNSYKNGTVNEITIDYNKRTIKVQGTV